jgi:hypothetical protein
MRNRCYVRTNSVLDITLGDQVGDAPNYAKKYSFSCYASQKFNLEDVIFANRSTGESHDDDNDDQGPRAVTAYL